MFKTALFDCAINKKCCSVDGGRGICPLFSSPPRGIWQLKSPHPREFAIQDKNNANARGGGSGRRWNWLMHYYYHFFNATKWDLSSQTFKRPFLLFSFLIFRRLELIDSLILHVECTVLRPIFRSLGSKILYPTYLTRRGQLSCHPSQRFFELVYRHFTASVHTIHTFIEYIPIWGFQWTKRITKLK